MHWIINNEHIEKSKSFAILKLTQIYVTTGTFGIHYFK